MSEIIVTSNQPTLTPAPEAKASAAAEEVKTTASQAIAQDEESGAEADETEETDGDETTEEGKPQSKRPSGAARAKARLQEKDREIEFLRRQLDANKAPAEKQEPKPQVASADVEPDVNDPKFETYGDYLKALARWEIRQSKQEEETKAKQEQAKAKFTEKVTNFEGRVAAFMKANPDFEDVIEAADEPPMAPHILIEFNEHVTDSESGPEILYWLAKNPDDYARICAMTDPRAVARELGKIEARLEKSEPSPTEESKPIKQTTKAPPPPTPLKGSATVAKKSSLEIAASGSQAEYEAARKKEMALKRA
jgi:hypothetical protein